MGDRSLPQVAKQVAQDLNRLLKLEAQLLAERAKAGIVKKALFAAVGAGGLLFLLFGLLFLLAAAAAGIANVLPWWLALLIVGGGAVVLGAILALVAMAGIRSSGGIVPDDAKDAVGEDVRWLREQSG